ncbi:hypothetical protein GH5_07513 [Leishmania sp. Ghana 2012 LV757]|uniref:hypothetical protein n=1 Tax=Leishmania sp. Ghana 2012 LV757 TaxID=2803181 RepID=UPI001B752D8D|nr:hypothetical protein GH5_07513 [Leishmania sp. Ghana 2012 LV757]
MLSMFKDKKGFSVLFKGGEARGQPATVAETSQRRRPSTLLPDTAACPRSFEVAQHQCQRCSKRFSALESDDEREASYQCHRCGYPTCPQCREAAAGSPPWVCCVCTGFKSIMWLLERTRAGPMLVTKIVEYCDPRGQRLMRSMFRFTLQQYQSLSPRPSIKFAGRASDGPAASGGSSCSRPTSQTPPTCPMSRTRASSRLSGERTAARLSQVPASVSNACRPSPYTHPKHGSLLRSLRRSDSGAALTFGAGAVADAEDAAKENSPVVERIARGSEALRRIEEAVGVVEYSPESKWRASCDASGEAEGSDEPSPSLSDGCMRFAHLEACCTAVADIYRARASDVPAGGATSRAAALDAEAPSPHVRASGRAAFQREALQPQLGSADGGATPKESDNAVVPVNAPLAPETSSMRITPSSQPCRLGRSVSPASGGSGRSVSPAPRFPTFGQFLEDHGGIIDGQTHLPRDSVVLVTVSPETENEDEDSSGVIQLGGARCGNRLVASSGYAKEGLNTPRGAHPRTPPSAGGGCCSSGLRSGRRTSGLGDFTPTRVLDLSSARGTLHHRSSSRRRATRGSLQEIHAPHLYGNSTANSKTAGNARRSGQTHDSPYMYGLPSQFSSHMKPAGLACGQVRRQHAPLATRTAGRALGSDGRQRLVRQHTHTPTPLQRTASRNNELQRMPSRNGVLARTNSSFAQLTRTASSHGYGPRFARTNSSSAHVMACTAPHPVHVTRATSGRRRLQRTESVKLMRTGLGRGAAAGGAPQGTAALERTHSRYGTPAAGGALPTYSSPLTRTLSSWSPLKRTTSHVCLSGGGATPLGRTQSQSSFVRSATANTGFVVTSSIAKAGGRVPPRHAPGGLTRTATGTNLCSYSRGRLYDGARHPPVPSPLQSSSTLCSSARGAPGSYHRAVATSPVRRTVTATRVETPKTSRRRCPTPTALSRTGAGARNFDRQQSNTMREPAWRTGGATWKTVDRPPTLVSVTRRRAVEGTLRRTPSATAAVSSVVATPRTPRQYIITSVKVAATAGIVNGGGLHSGSRPVLSSGASSSKTRSSRGSLNNGGTAGNRSNAGSVLAEGKVAALEDGMGRSSMQLRHPLVGATATKEKVFSRGVRQVQH